MQRLKIAMLTPEEHDKVTPFWGKRRYAVLLMLFFGFFNIYALRVNLSVGIVAMTEVRNVTLENGTIVQKVDFDWDSKQKGQVLGSFFYGYVVTHLIGSYLASRFGGHLVRELF